MKQNVSAAMLEMTNIFGGDLHQINHAMKVYAFARIIGQAQGLDEYQQYILDLAGILHDIGIPRALQVHGSAAGNFQEQEGPSVSDQILHGLEEDGEVMETVRFLIAHHHTYTNIVSPLHQILVEADFLVNLDEGNIGRLQAASVRDNIFKTSMGIQLLTRMFLNEEKESAQ